MQMALPSRLVARQRLRAERLELTSGRAEAPVRFMHGGRCA